MSINLSLQQIVQQLGGSVLGESATPISRVGSLALAQTGAISFFSDTKYRSEERRVGKECRP